jgi:DNA primase
VKEIEGVEFGDALRILANKAGVELKRQTPEYTKLKSERQKLYEICELATKFFEKQMQESRTGKEAREYLLKRGLTEESIRKWRIGYAPDVWQGLSDFLDSRNYSREEIEKSGLGLSSEKGSFYDRFRGRIIFPVFDLNSQVIGFGGRVFKEKDKAEIAKYVNTPQTMLYDKSRTLYGLDKAKVAIRKQDFCIMVEGYMDLIMVSQAGFENVVATSGTALTPSQLNILKRFTDKIYSSFDMDVAGDNATKRGIELARAQDFEIKVIVLPEGKDPAEAILKDVKIWEDSLKSAKSILDFYFETTLSKFDKKTPEGKKEISGILLPVIKRVPNRIVQSHWISKLAEELDTREANIEAELEKVRTEGYSEALGIEPEEIKNLPVKTRRELLEERLIVLFFKKPDVFNEITEKQLSVFSPPIREIILKLKENPKAELKDFNAEIAEMFNLLSLQSEIEEIAERDIASEIQYCLSEINSLELKNKLDDVSKEIKKAENEKDEKKAEELTRKFNQLIKDK